MKFSKPTVRLTVRFLLTLLFSFAIGGLFFLVTMLQYPHFPFEMLRRGIFLLVFYGLIMSVISLIVFPMIGRWNRRPELSFNLILQAFVALLLMALLSNWIVGHLILLIYPDLNVLNRQQYAMLSVFAVMVGGPIFLYMTVRKYWKEALQKVREKELAEERLEKELLAARLQALQAQTNPHFLCNALNSIAALIATDPAGAEAAVERLASLFRYAADSHGGRLAVLAEETAVIEDYLAIEKVRFGERLQLKISIDPPLLKCLVPPLLLQPLVENAIKHGVSQREDQTVVEIKAEAADRGKLRFVVRNQGPALAPEESRQGTGLRNLQSRCHTLFGEDYGFRLSETTPGWIEAELVIPRAAAEKADGGKLFVKESL